MNNDFDELNKSRIKVRLLKAFGFGGLIYVVINLCLNYSPIPDVHKCKA